MMLQQARSSGVTYQVSLFGRTGAHALNHKCLSHVGDLTDALHQTCSQEKRIGPPYDGV